MDTKKKEDIDYAAYHQFLLCGGDLTLKKSCEDKDYDYSKL